MAFRFASYGFSAASSEPSLRVATSSVSIETTGSGYSPSPRRRSKSSVRSPSSRARNAPFKTMVGVIVTPDFAIGSMTSLYACAVALCFGV